MGHLTELRSTESRTSGAVELRLVESRITPDKFLDVLRDKLSQIGEYQMELARRRAAPGAAMAAIEKADVAAELEACALEELLELAPRRGGALDPPAMVEIEALYASIAVVEATIVAGVMTSEIIRRGNEMLRAIPAKAIRRI